MEILIIDDSRLSRNMFKNALGTEHTYSEASDGMHGIEMYFLKKPDLVILDLTMPGANGFEVLKQLKTLDPKALIIVGTADVQESSQTLAHDLGAAGFIFKPFTEEKVRQTVHEILKSNISNQRPDPNLAEG